VRPGLEIRAQCRRRRGIGRIDGEDVDRAPDALAQVRDALVDRRTGR
jgi:hypothetical protein